MGGWDGFSLAASHWVCNCMASAVVTDSLIEEQSLWLSVGVNKLDGMVDNTSVELS